MSAQTTEVAVPWFSRRRAIIALILGFVLPLPWPEVPLPAGLLMILFVAVGGDTGDHNGVVLGGPVLLSLALASFALIYAAGLYVATTLWLLFREWRRWE